MFVHVYFSYQIVTYLRAGIISDWGLKQLFEQLKKHFFQIKKQNLCIRSQGEVRLKNCSLQSKCQWIQHSWMYAHLHIIVVYQRYGKLQVWLFTFGIPWQFPKQKFPIFVAQCLWICSLPLCLHLKTKALAFSRGYKGSCRRPRRNVSYPHHWGHLAWTGPFIKMRSIWTNLRAGS